MTVSQLIELLENALKYNQVEMLEKHLIEHSNLPGPRGNLELLHAFADAIGHLVTQPDLPVEALETMLDRWSTDSAEVTDPRVMLPCAAVLAYGQAGASRPDWWDDETAKLYHAASDPRWRVREMVAAALQRMLAADWERTCQALSTWATDDHPLVIRAAVAGVADPPLLSSPVRAKNALVVQQHAIARFAAFPSDIRRSENVRTLRQALGFTMSVVAVAIPDDGFCLFEQLAMSSDDDLRWIVRENLKKKRLKPWADRVAAIQAMMM